MNDPHDCPGCGCPEREKGWPFWKQLAVGTAIALAAGGLMLAFFWKGIFPPQ